MRLMMILALCCVAVTASCSKEHDNLPLGFRYEPPPTPADLTVEGQPDQAILSWTYPSEALGAIKEFRVYYYSPVYDMVELIGTTSVPSYVDENLVGNLTYCYKVSAVDTTGLEGWRTDAECAFIPDSD